MNLTPEQLGKLKNANLSNLVKKLKAGKTLTAAEIKLIDAAEIETSSRKDKEEKSKIPDVAQSMKQAEAFWGISVSTMRIAKAAGCPAFVQHRIHRDALVEWLEKNPTAVGKGEALTDAAELKRQKTEAEVRLLRAKISREERETIPLAEAKAEWGRAASIVQEEAKQLMEKDHYRVFVERCKSRIGEILVE
jgi:hypothetical protein